MNPLSTRIRKREAPQRPLPDPYQSSLVSRRRSSRIESRQRSVSISHVLGSYYESPSSLEERPTDPRASQPLKATLYPRVPTSGPVEASAPVPSRAQVQEYIYPPQKHNHQTRKRGPDTSIETGAERPLKRVRLTQRNLKAFENMRGQRRKSTRKMSTGRVSCTTTTTHEDLGPQRYQPKSETLNSESKSTRSKQSISTTDTGFQDATFDNGILNPENSKPHTNLKKSKVQINRTRDTVSLSESKYEKFAHKVRTAPNEQTVLLQTSLLLKEYETDDSRYSKVYNQAFITFLKNVGFNTVLSATQPDMVKGIEMLEFDPFPVRQQLSRATIPTSGTNAITLLHLAREWKGLGKDIILVQTQLTSHRSSVAPSVLAETTDSTSYEYNNEEDPSSQLLTEY
ncbi:hypothetical protein BJ875DRAFT_546055 [Amylocarpus encephaloides]|uniref:Uncharacterized protein n=1 Tax=Amylocarpus encephaloides TaxID=45428 RepID=A0A9P7YCB3_9HELO|nr:hypothetical protein BJ875DRAFT_546055 [Amylocarpus encephaloides]